MRGGKRRVAVIFHNKRKLIGAILAFSVGILVLLAIEKFVIIRQFSIDRFIILSSIVGIISLHFVLDIKGLWDFIFRKRFFIGIILFLFVVINGYHDSSIGYYNSMIQPNHPISTSEPLFGEIRPIRSDEYLVSTPSFLSQTSSNPNFTSINHIMMARDTVVTLFPKLPTKDVTVIGTPNNYGALFLPEEQAFSFANNLLYFLLFFGALELFLILTKGKRSLSLLGALLLFGSPAIRWWGSPAILTYGILATVFFQYFLTTKYISLKAIFMTLIGIFGSAYIMTVYPAWQIPYGYLFLILFIWLLYDNRSTWTKQNIKYVPIAIVVMLIVVLPAYIGSNENLELIAGTVYPGTRISNGGGGSENLFLYIPSVMFSILSPGNSSEASTSLTLYPLPILIGLYFSFVNMRKRKNDILLNLLLVTTLVLLSLSYFELPLLAKITFLSMSTTVRTQVVIGVLCIFIIIVLLAHYESAEKIKVQTHVIALVVASGITIYAMYVSNLILLDYFEIINVIVLSLLFIFLMYFLILNRKKTNRVLTVVMYTISLFVAFTVMPLSRGIDIMREKPFAKEVQKIVKENPDAKWISANSNLFVSSYVVANGAKIYNSTNFFPNFDFWNVVDPNQKYKDMYNRYAHVIININQKKEIVLNAADSVTTTMNTSDIKSLDISYIASTDPGIEELSDEIISFNQLYAEDGIYIYTVEVRNIPR